MKRYYEEFKFKHPTPNEFKRVAEKVSDLELEWYLNEWTRTPHKIDYGIDISSLESERVITLKRKARIPMPIEVVVSFEDGSWGLIRASSNKPSLVVVTESPSSEERKKKIFDFINGLLQKTGKND